MTAEQDNWSAGESGEGGIIRPASEGSGSNLD